MLVVLFIVWFVKLSMTLIWNLSPCEDRRRTTISTCTYDRTKTTDLVAPDEGSGSTTVDHNSRARKPVGGDRLVGDNEICDGPDGRVRPHREGEGEEGC